VAYPAAEPAPADAQGSTKRDPFHALLALAERHGDVAPYRSGRNRAFLVNHPDLVRHVLADNAANYRKDTFINERFRVAVADGLLTSEGVVWRRDRRLMQPAFHRDRLASLASAIVAAVATVSDRWAGIAGSGRTVDMTAEMGSLTLRITAAVLFGADISTSARGIGRLISNVMAHLPSPENSAFRAAKHRVEALADDVIERRRSTGPAGDLLSLLQEARDEQTGEGMGAQQLRDQVITLLVAGYETTANALSWTWYLLSQNPDSMRGLQDELGSVLRGSMPDGGTLPQLSRTRMVIEEALRLYPPAWILGRRALSDDRLGDRPLPAGSVVAISPYALHRHPAFWEQPDRFDPSRFAPALAATRHRFAYIPFGAGPRLCIGHNLAMMEAQLALAALAARFSPQLVPGAVVVPERRFTLRPRGGLPMTIRLTG
jgi:cytochrome P450